MNAVIAALLLSYSSGAMAFATHDMPKRTQAKVAARVARDYGAPVKRDLSHNRCVEKGKEEYRLVLFYEEFNTLAECEAANERG